MTKKIGLYGGTFDPVHFGHLNAALEVQEKRGLDEIWFCPAHINPHKVSSPPNATPQQRLEMLKLALSDLPSFKIVDAEITRTGPSYTFDTLRSMLSENARESQQDQFFLIIGEDSVPGFFHWFEPEKIVQMASLVVVSRSLSMDFSLLEGSQILCDAIKKGWTAIRIMDISSTEVRRRLKSRQYCGHLVPHKTLCHIYKNQLYFNS